MAGESPVIVDSRGDNTVVNLPRQLLANLRNVDIAINALTVEAFLLLEAL